MSIHHALDGRLWVWLRDVPGAYAPVTIVADGERALPLWTTRAAARAGWPDRPEGVRLQALEPSDLRAKEELLRAAEILGTDVVAVDPDGVAERAPVTDAIAYVRAFKRGTACL